MFLLTQMSRTPLEVWGFCMKQKKSFIGRLKFFAPLFLFTFVIGNGFGVRQQQYFWVSQQSFGKSNLSTFCFLAFAKFGPGGKVQPSLGLVFTVRQRQISPFWLVVVWLWRVIAWPNKSVKGTHRPLAVLKFCFYQGSAASLKSCRRRAPYQHVRLSGNQFQ